MEAPPRSRLIGAAFFVLLLLHPRVLAQAPQVRVTTDLLVKYDFEEGTGTTVNDVSGSGAPLNLTIPNPAAVSWVSGGLRINSSTLIASGGPATKIINGLASSNEVTIEAWIRPQNTTQLGPARIVTISGDASNRNITLGQGLWGNQPSALYNARLRTTATNSNGQPELSTPNGSLTTALTHVVYTRNSAGLARFFVNGVEQASMTVAGMLSNWSSAYGLGLGNEFNADRPWLGTFHLVAVYKRALSLAEIGQNLSAGADPSTPPSITLQPANQTVASGASATFSITSAGSAPLSFQWQKNGVNIPGANSSTYITPPTSSNDNGATFRCIVSNSTGTLTSESATLFVTTSAPLITQNPANQTVSVGQPATFSVVAAGTQPLNYQWQRNGFNIAGANGSSYTLTSAAISDNGTSFRCIVSNAAGEATSQSALLTVTTIPSRVTSGLIVRYDFDEGNGTTVNDVSGTGTPMNLSIANLAAVSWISGGLRVNSPTLIASAGAASKVHNAVTVSNEITVEAWISPGNTTQSGPARIVSISGDAGNRNITLGQGLWGTQPTALYNARLRTTSTNSNGQPELSTPDGSLTTALTHVVYTRNASGTAKFFINGVERASFNVAGTFSNWNSTYRLGLANELGAERPWLGTFHLVAMYSRALSAAEVGQNHAAGADPSIPPSIAIHPANQSVEAGQTATFSVTATGPSQLFYQWQKNGTDIAGANTSSYTTPPVFPADNGSQYRCIVSNGGGGIISNAATLTVTGTAPSITTHPVSQSVLEGTPVTFSIAATGTAPLSYQWQKNNTDIAGATGSTYTLTAALSDNGASFRCIVTNPVGSSASDAAVLGVGLPSYVLSVGVTGNGTVQKSPDQPQYTQGESVTLTAMPGAGNRFAGWGGDVISTDNPLTVLMSVNKSLLATFVLNTYTITATAGPNGTISPSGSVEVSHGGDRTFAISPDAGYSIHDVMVDGISVGAVSAYTFSNVTGPHTIDAAFVLNTYVITATAGSGGTISPSGGIQVNHGASQAFTISATTGYSIQDVLVDGTSVGAVGFYQFENVTSSRTIEAVFLLNTYPLTTTAVGGGLVSRNPDLVRYPHGTTVELTAIPDSGKTFVAWSGAAASTTNPISVTMNAAKSITATFSSSIYTIAAAAGPGGSISPSGSLQAGHGDTLSFVITPDDGYSIADVLVDGVSVGAVSVYELVNITQSHSISASFSLNSYQLETVVNGNGSIVRTPDLSAYIHGSTVDLEAVPGAFHSFAGWTGDTVTSANPISLEMKRGRSVTATFTINTYEITAIAGTNGRISPSGAIQVPHGGTQTFSITPDTGYYIADVLIDGVPAGVLPMYEFTNVTAPHTIEAIFAINVYTISASAGPNGSISPEGNVPVSHGSDRLFTITPDPGYTVADVEVDGVSIGAVTSYQFTSVAAPHSISASFELVRFAVSISVAGSGAVTRTPDLPLYDPGTPVELTATADTDHFFAGWSGDTTTSVNPLTLIMERAYSLTASFNPLTETITATAGQNGAIFPAGEVSVPRGSTLTFSITPNEGYHITDVLVDGVSVGAVSSYSFTDIASPHTIEAFFSPNSYPLTLVVTGNGSVTRSPDLPLYPHGTSVELNASPANQLLHWSGDTSSTSNPLIIVMNGATSLTAAFGAPPAIAQQPLNQTVISGLKATFIVGATGTGPLAFQWQRNGINIPGATSAIYQLSPANTGDNGATFRCIVTSSLGETTSNSATLTVTSQVTRVTNGVLVQYGFDEGNGTTVNDISGNGAPLNLAIPNAGVVSWVPGGLRINSSTLISSAGPAAKVHTGVTSTNEVTLEAWIQPANTTQKGPARIVTFSTDPSNRNITLGQGLWDNRPSALYNARLRTTTTNSNGQPEMSSPDGSLTTALTHVVYTRNAAGAAKLFINGVERAAATIGGTLANWNASYNLGLGNEFNGERPWLGTFHLLAVYGRALTPSEIGQNFSAGADPPFPPSIVTHPANQAIVEGGTATFSVSATGTGLAYQWLKDGAVIPNAVAASYTTPPLSESDEGASYRCLVYNNAGSVQSDSAVITVDTSPLAIVSHPANTVVQQGTTAVFIVSATGTPPLSYQWQRNGINIPGATGATYITPPVTLSDNGAVYRCLVSNANGTITSNSAILTISTSSLAIGPWQRHLVDPARPGRAVFIFPADIDGDGYRDIVTGGYWYRNPGTPGGTWVRSAIGSPFVNAAAVGDFNGDGKPDIIGTSGPDNFANNVGGPISFSWARNNGNGTFTIHENLPPANGNFLQGSAVGRLQPGGPLKVVLGFQYTGAGIQTYTIPPDPVGTEWQWTTIYPTSQGEAVSLGDIDRDANTDVLIGTKWIRNNTTTWTENILHPVFAEVDRSKLVDMNGDGRLDAIVCYQAESAPGKVAWYEQGLSPTANWTEHVVAIVTGPMSMDVADIDADGDYDIIVGEHNLLNPASARQLVFENVDGTGTTWQQYVVHTGDEHHDGSQVVDIDNDGDLDIISIGWRHGKVVVYENLAVIAPVTTIPPSVSKHPEHQITAEGQSATFTVQAAGTSPHTFQWQRNGANIPGATSASYTVSAATIDLNGSSYRCRVTNAAGAVFTDNATLVVNSPTTSRVAWTVLSSAAGDLLVPAPGGTEQTATIILDVDNDGLTDFVIANRSTGPAVVWYRRTATGWERKIIEPAQMQIEAGGTYYDIDGDGDLDIVFGGDHQSNQVWWWENPSPDFSSPWTRRTIKNSGGSMHHDMVFGDFDNDGRAELVFWILLPRPDGDKLCHAPIPDNPKTAGTWPFAVLFQGTGPSEGIAKADIDGDGLVDILAGGHWFKYVIGTGFVPNVIDITQKNTRVAVAQLIPGGRPEVVFNSGDANGPLTWHEWNGTEWTRNVLVNTMFAGHSLAIADFDHDGHLDIFAAEMRLATTTPRMSVFYGNGAGVFAEQSIAVAQDNHESYVADLDGDGDPDILSKPYNFGTPAISVWLNNGTGIVRLPINRWTRRVIDNARPDRALFVNSADMNGDGLKDIVMGAWWYRNPGTAGGTWQRQVIGFPLNNMAAVYDFDGDGDMDVLGTQGFGASNNSNFVWARNDGVGNFTIFNNIQSGVGPFLQGVTVGKFMPDSSLQVILSWNDQIGGLQALTVPADPANSIWTWSQISTTSLGEGLDHGDIDGDGDLDLLLGTVWLRNEGGSWTPFTISTESQTIRQADRNFLVDMDGDGDLDAVVGFGHDPGGKLAWYENPANPTDLWIEHVIAFLPEPSIPIHGVQSVSVVDIDGDGDWDVIAGEHSNPPTGNEGLYLFENTDGRGGSWIQHLIHRGDEHHVGALAVDIDGDGDLDLVSMGWGHARTLIYENGAITRTPPVPARITQHPSNATAVLGLTALFSVTATGTQPISYQWQRDGVSIPGATNPSYTFAGVSAADDSSRFRCVVSNLYGSDTSAYALLTVITSASRATEGLLALYTFNEGSGNVVNDVSGAGEPLNLMIPNPAAVTWVAGGLRTNSSTLLSSGSAATKINNALASSNAVTIEGWLNPSNTTQKGPARIVTISAGSNDRNITLGQGLWGDQPGDLYNLRLRTTATNSNGQPEFTTAAGTLSTALTHVVATRDAGGAIKFYLNGAQVVASTLSGNLSNWNAAYKIGLANEFGADRPWLGTFHLVAIYNRALSPTEVTFNYLAGAEPLSSSSAPTASPSPSLDIPREHALYQNYPNPFNPSTIIRYDMPAGGPVSIRLYNVLGQEVLALVNDIQPAGRHTVTLDASSLASGTYFYRMQSGAFSNVKKLLIVK